VSPLYFYFKGTTNMKTMILLLLITTNIFAASANLDAASIPDIQFNTTYFYGDGDADIDKCITTVNDRYINPVTDTYYIEDVNFGDDTYTDLKDACKARFQ